MNPILNALTHCVKPFVLLLLFISFTTYSAAQKTIKAKAKVHRVFYGEASFYANKFNGRQTANGEIFHQDKLTGACNAVPLGTWIKVTNVKNGRSVIVKVTDRLHPRMRRVVDLSKAAARKLGYVGNGVARVKLEVIGRHKPE